MKKLIEVTVTVSGMHQWKDAPDSVAFLRNSHRHSLIIKARKQVRTNDREIEFYLFQNEVIQTIDLLYEKDALNIYQFQNRSCETIASELVTHLALDYCSVSEDGENRAIVIRED